MPKEIRNLPESVKGRLRNYALAHHLRFEFVMRQYVQERVAFRLGNSTFANRLLLKGGFYLIALHIPRERSTKDIDLLAMGFPAEEREVRRLVDEVCAMKIDDGVRLDASSLMLSRTSGEKDGYEGFRAKFAGFIGPSRSVVQLDIAFGDDVLEATEAVELLSLIGMPPPRIRAYPLESIVSEKVEAMVKLEMRNSRMNDFFDIYRVSGIHGFAGARLKRPIPEKIPALTPEFYDRPDKQRLWDTYLSRNRIHAEGLTLALVSEGIRAFIMPVLESCTRGAEFDLIWVPGKRRWQEQ